jgi:hypothetical protein
MQIYGHASEEGKIRDSGREEAEKSKCKIILRHFSLHHHRFVLFFPARTSPPHPNFSINCDFTPSAHIYINSLVPLFPSFFAFRVRSRHKVQSNIFSYTTIDPHFNFPRETPSREAVFIVFTRLPWRRKHFPFAAGIFTRKFFLATLFSLLFIISKVSELLKNDNFNSRSDPTHAPSPARAKTNLCLNASERFSLLSP